MKKLSSIITGLASLTTGFTVVSYENGTHLSQRFLNDRPALEAQVTKNQTSYGVFNQPAFKGNMVEIEKFSLQYRCVMGDLSKCRTSWKGL